MTSPYALPAIVAVTLVTVGDRGVRAAAGPHHVGLPGRLAGGQSTVERRRDQRRVPVGGVVPRRGRAGAQERRRHALVPGRVRRRVPGPAAVRGRPAAPVAARSPCPTSASCGCDSARLRKLAAGFVVFIGWLYLVPQLQGAGLTLQTVTGGPYALGAVVVAVVVTANVALGGMRAITFVQAFQYWLKLTALAVPVIFLVLHWQAAGRPDPAAAQGERRSRSPPPSPCEQAATLTLVAPTEVTARGSVDQSRVDGTVSAAGRTAHSGRGDRADVPGRGARAARLRRERPAGLARARQPGRGWALRRVLADPGHVPGHHGPAARAGPLLHQPGRRRGPAHHPGRARPGRPVLPLPDPVRRARPGLHARSSC